MLSIEEIFALAYQRLVTLRITSPIKALGTGHGQDTIFGLCSLSENRPSQAAQEIRLSHLCPVEGSKYRK